MVSSASEEEVQEVANSQSPVAQAKPCEEQNEVVCLSEPNKHTSNIKSIPFSRMSRSKSRKLEENGQPYHPPNPENYILNQNRNATRQQSPSNLDDSIDQSFNVPGKKTNLKRTRAEVLSVDSPQPHFHQPPPTVRSQPPPSSPPAACEVEVVEDQKSPLQTENASISRSLPTRNKARRLRKLDPSQPTSVQPAQKNDDINKEKTAPNSENRPTTRRSAATRLGRAAAPQTAQNEAINVDLDGESDVDSSSPPNESAPQKRGATAPTNRKRSPQVVVVDKDVQDEVKSLSPVDAPYDGPTELIFQYPPGERGKIEVTAEERERLKRRKYLNDSFIDFYMKYLEGLVRGCHPKNSFNAKFFGSFFFRRLRSISPIDYEGVKGWTKSEDLFKMKYIFVPICDSYHWSLMIVANMDKFDLVRLQEAERLDNERASDVSSNDRPKLIYLDSLDPKRGTSFADAIKAYLAEEWFHRRVKDGKTDLTRVTVRRYFTRLELLKPNVPVQTNEYDCGLYLLLSLKLFLTNEGDARNKLLSGVKDLYKLYNHCEVKALRKDMIDLICTLERDWSRKHPAKGLATSATKNSESENRPVALEAKAPHKAVQEPANTRNEGEASELNGNLASQEAPSEPLVVNEGENGEQDASMDVESSEHAHIGGGEVCDLTKMDYTVTDEQNIDEVEGNCDGIKFHRRKEAAIVSQQSNDVDMEPEIHNEEDSNSPRETGTFSCQIRVTEIGHHLEASGTGHHEQIDAEDASYDKRDEMNCDTEYDGKTVHVPGNWKRDMAGFDTDGQCHSHRQSMQTHEAYDRSGDGQVGDYENVQESAQSSDVHMQVVDTEKVDADSPYDDCGEVLILTEQ